MFKTVSRNNQNDYKNKLLSNQIEVQAKDLEMNSNEIDISSIVVHAKN